jgi:DNA polymerase-1
MILLGIDGTNWMHQLWHALGAQGVQVVHGNFLGWVRAVVEYVQPGATVICFDRRSFRYDLSAEYKAARPEKAVGLKALLEQAPAHCAEVATIAQQDGFEADDCLATLARLGRIQNRVVLASCDKDLRQCLVDERVTILRKFGTRAGKLSSPEWFTAGELRKKYGLEPEQWPSYQALVGDAGDGVRGCEGWGEKTAVKALAVGRTLAGCLANHWKLPITVRQRTALLAFQPRAELTLRLVTLRTDVEAVADALR